MREAMKKPTHKELTQRVRQLKEENAQLSAFMDNIPGVAYIKDDSGRHIYCNKTLSKKFAISPEEFIGTTAYDFFPKQEAKRLEGHDRKIRSQKTTINVPPWNDGMKITCGGGRKSSSRLPVLPTRLLWRALPLRSPTSCSQRRP